MYDPSMRVLTVLELLQAHERVTGAELARRLEVSSRTVQRYIARLQDLGIPVESTRGVGGAYRLKPGFRLPPLMFSGEEALALALGLHALHHLGLTALAPAVAGAGAKLARTLPHALRERVRTLEDAVQLDASPWTIPTDASVLACLLAAVGAERTVAFDYRSHQGTQTRREVEVYGVVHLDGRWYAVGRCCLRNALRSFRLDRISGPAELERPFTRPPDFDARAYLRATLPFVRAPFDIKVWLGLPPEEAALRFSPWQVVLEPDAVRGGTRLRCTREHLEPFAAMLLGLGCAFTVHAPAELREVFAGLAERASAASLRTHAGDPRVPHGSLPG
ncbi:helix-turn-helix transcriptional regulator [Deinococcus apachensis]|uniref:helix-turn-helix transcriptional regulator n=1 Tax=Deinococcus apachensis TaxID=309886 RepID=UPI00037842EA|nr:YafY family protein [Deinococcus apachensis]